MSTPRSLQVPRHLSRREHPLYLFDQNLSRPADGCPICRFVTEWDSQHLSSWCSSAHRLPFLFPDRFKWRKGVTKAVGALALLSVLNVLLNSIPKISENVTLAATM